MTGIVKNHEVGVTKSAGSNINKREAQVAHARSFGDLIEKAAAAGGLPGDQVPYWDPMGFLSSRGDPINLKDKMFQKWAPVYESFNEYAAEGYSIRDAAEKAITAKAVDRTSYSLPIFFTPDVFITDQEDLPLADMMARTAVQEDTVKVDELTDTGAASQFSEGATAWPENDDTYSNHTYDVVSYGRQNSVTDFVQLAANTLRSTRALTEDQQVRSIRQYEERQLIVGKATNVDATANDANGFDSLSDLATGTITDEAGATITLSKVRDNIRELRRSGASRDDIVHVTDHKTFQDLQEDVQDFTRYDTPSDDFSFGFQALDIDGTMVMESHGSPNTSTERMFTSFDASANYMAMLQDVTMHPLARSSPEETFATDAYGVLVSEAPSRITVRHGLA
ncbi:major head protein [Haloarcula hispanica tailed virus 2]|uniref:Major capsid protein n=1 Tax=Haloarcula hispanica tailed virus 2 TaxID=1273751 RepID=R4T690_9CAUD|nr:major head protein [Haloarcula hispanica tailed virus 2]AGM11204.1 major capsid protein [Haloarcula hispanica tailed virus 2]